MCLNLFTFLFLKQENTALKILDTLPSNQMRTKWKGQVF